MRYSLTIPLLLCSYISSAQQSFNLDSLYNWQDPLLPASSAHLNVYNEVWGYTSNGKEYAIMGSTAGTHIFDVTVPAFSEEVAFVEGAVTGPQVVHRDYHDHAGYLYMVCDEGQSTLQIADLQFLPDSVPVVYNSDGLFPRAHNIFIDTTSARMYVCGGTVQFAVYSLDDPTDPTLLLDCPSDVPFWSSIGYVHDAYVRSDTAYLNAGQNGFFVVDFSDTSNVRMLGSLDSYLQQGYNHSGWLMRNQPYYALADETHGMDVKILDVSDMSDIQVVDTISTDVHSFSIPHNPIYEDDLLFVAYYFDGLYVFDCSDPAHPVLYGYYDTSLETHQDGVYRGCWGVYPFLPSGNILASDMQTGLWVFGSPHVSGMDDVAEDQRFHPYPNPTSERLFFTEQLSQTPYTIVDAHGRPVMSGRVGSEINVSALSFGVYAILLAADGSVTHHRFVKL